MSMVAVCVDTAPPAEAATFSSCTAVAWTDSANVAPGLFDGLTMDSVSPVAVSILSLWALAFCIRAIVGVVRDTA
jgi:hypothetical protein